MSMSTSVTAIIPPDEKWKQMKAVYDACRNAGIIVPNEVNAFFNDEPPDSAGVVVHLTTYPMHNCVSEYQDEGAQGFEVDLEKLPPHVKRLRFVNSW